jgi:hypothetical protein
MSKQEIMKIKVRMDGTNLIFDVINGDLFVVVDFKLKSNGAFSSSSKCSLVR